MQVHVADLVPGENGGKGANALEIEHCCGLLSAPVKPARSRWCKSIALKV